MEELNVSAGASSAVVRMESEAPEASEEERARLDSHATFLQDAKNAVDAAKKKVEKAEAHLEGAKDAVRAAEAHLATLEGRE